MFLTSADIALLNEQMNLVKRKPKGKAERIIKKKKKKNRGRKANNGKK